MLSPCHTRVGQCSNDSTKMHVYKNHVFYSCSKLSSSPKMASPKHRRVLSLNWTIYLIRVRAVTDTLPNSSSSGACATESSSNVSSSKESKQQRERLVEHTLDSLLRVATEGPLVKDFSVLRAVKISA